MNNINPICSQYENTSFLCPTDRSLGVRLAMYHFLIVCILITVFGNLALIISITHFKQLHSPTNFLILSLTVTDFFLGFIIMPYSMVRLVERCWYFGGKFCKIHYSLDWMLSVISIFHLCSIAIDRFYAVCDPLHYPTKMTIPVIQKMILFCWSVPPIVAFTGVVTNSHVFGIKDYELLVACFNLCPISFTRLWSLVMFMICFVTPTSVMAGIYIKIFIVSQKHTKILKGMTGKMKDEVANQISKKQDRKAAKTLGIVIGVFLTCWVPCFIIGLIDAFLNYPIPEVLFDALNFFGYINSTCNPLIYGFFYPWFRKALKFIILGKIFDPHTCTTNLS